MSYINEFPHSRMFDSDLRQILEMYNTVKGLPKTWEEFSADLHNDWDAVKLFVNTYFTELDVQQEINNKIDGLVADGTIDSMLKEEFDTYTQEINARLSNYEAEITARTRLLESRMDTFTSLPAESTTGDAEVADGRVDYTGKTWENIGGHIREVTSQLSSEIVELGNSYNYFTDKLTWNVGYINTQGGIAENSSERRYSNPIYCIPFETVYFKGETDHTNISALTFYDSENDAIRACVNVGDVNTEHSITVPANAIYMRLSVNTLKQDLENCYVRTENPLLQTVAEKVIDGEKKNSVFYVNGTRGVGNDDNDGSINNPLRTIQKAIDRGAETVIVEPMTYNENISVSNKKSFHLVSKFDTDYDSSGSSTTRKVVIANAEADNCAYFENIQNLTIEGVVFEQSNAECCRIYQCHNVNVTDCEFNSSVTSNGLGLYGVNGVFNNCIAHDNANDGFNINYFGDTTFNNCIAYNNGDDGISHHQACTGFINGGEYYGNVKGGVSSPTHGAKVNINGVYMHDNFYGLYCAKGNATPRESIVSNCCITRNQAGIISDYPLVLFNNYIGNNTYDFFNEATEALMNVISSVN